MADFKDREEYEKWKAARLNERREKADQSAAGQGKEGDEERGKERAQDFGGSPEDHGGKGSLSDPFDLFRRTWDIYKRRVGVLISLYLLSFVILTGIFCIFLGSGYLLSVVFHTGRKVLPAIGAGMGIIAGVIVFMWGLAGVTYAVTDEDLGIRTSFVKGWSVIWPFTWVVSLVGYIVPGGFLLFFIPGVIFSVWFAFAQFIFIAEGVKGMDCLLKSKEYVRGLWPEVFFRLFLLWIVSVAAGSIPILGPLFSFLFMPYFLIFIWLLYNDVKDLKGEVTYSAASAEKLKWIGAATAGYLALPLFVVLLMGASIMTLPFVLLKKCLLLRGY